jgi:hypothetical protein
VIPARRSDHAGGRHIAHQQVGERATRLEGAGDLKQFEFQRQPKRAEADVLPIHVERRRPANIRSDDAINFFDGGAGDVEGHERATVHHSADRTLP